MFNGPCTVKYLPRCSMGTTLDGSSTAEPSPRIKAPGFQLSKSALTTSSDSAARAYRSSGLGRSRSL